VTPGPALPNSEPVDGAPPGGMPYIGLTGLPGPDGLTPPIPGFPPDGIPPGFPPGGIPPGLGLPYIYGLADDWPPPFI